MQQIRSSGVLRKGRCCLPPSAPSGSTVAQPAAPAEPLIGSLPTPRAGAWAQGSCPSSSRSSAPRCPALFRLLALVAPQGRTDPAPASSVAPLDSGSLFGVRASTLKLGLLLRSVPSLPSPLLPQPSLQRLRCPLVGIGPQPMSPVALCPREALQGPAPNLSLRKIRAQTLPWCSASASALSPLPGQFGRPQGIALRTRGWTACPRGLGH